MTHIENVKPGDWVLVVGHRCRECNCEHYSGYDGTPYLVLAIEIPFLLLSMPDDSAKGLDVREWTFKRIAKPKRYVGAWLRANWPGATAEDDDEPGARDDGHHRCVKCGERLRETKIGRHGWRWLCPTEDCGFDGGPVEG